MKKLIGVLVVVCAVFMIGCPTPNNGNEPTTGGKLPGKFAATVLSDAMGNSAARGVSLGTYTIANSKNIYFILRNVGDFPITDISLMPGKLTAEGEAFEPITDNGVTASPSAITVLETSGNTTVETVIEVDINHGNIIGLIAQQYVHKADFAGTTLRITGKTTDDEGEALDISLDLDIETLIKVASFEVHYSDDGGATYKKAGYGIPPMRDFPGYLIPLAGKEFIKILNTGNVPLRYKVWVDGDMFNWENYNEWVNFEAGAYSDSLSSHRYFGNFIIDTIGIVFDNGGINNNAFRAGTSIVGTLDINILE